MVRHGGGEVFQGSMTLAKDALDQAIRTFQTTISLHSGAECTTTTTKVPCLCLTAVAPKPSLLVGPGLANQAGHTLHDTYIANHEVQC
jgi:hypothetical protein